jgi:hypothetical protein
VAYARNDGRRRALTRVEEPELDDREGCFCTTVTTVTVFPGDAEVTAAIRGWGMSPRPASSTAATPTATTANAIDRPATQAAGPRDSVGAGGRTGGSG